jgi:hypothetical protein
MLMLCTLFLMLNKVFEEKGKKLKSFENFQKNTYRIIECTMY